MCVMLSDTFVELLCDKSLVCNIKVTPETVKQKDLYLAYTEICKLFPTNSLIRYTNYLDTNV